MNVAADALAVGSSTGTTPATPQGPMAVSARPSREADPVSDTATDAAPPAIDADWDVESLTVCIAAHDLRGSTLELAASLPDIYKRMVAAVGAEIAAVRFDQALVAALARPHS